MRFVFRVLVSLCAVGLLLSALGFLLAQLSVPVMGVSTAGLSVALVSGGLAATIGIEYASRGL